MDLLSLHFDVLHVVLSLLRPYDALQLAMTSRVAYATAMPRYLSEVTLSNSARAQRSKVAQYCAYILGDVPRRAQCLKILRIRDDAFRSFPAAESIQWKTTHDYAPAFCLAQVLRHAGQLRVVDIDRAEYLFEAMPVIADVLASCPNLHRIRLINVGPASLRLITRLSSRPSHIELDISDAANDDRQIRPSELLAPERDRFLHSLTHSLTSLTLARRPDILTLLEPHTVWPCVRRLSVWGNVGSLAALAAAFPALVYLHVPTLDLDVVDTLRPAVWPALDHVVTGCPLPLACPVRRLELHYDLDAIDEAAWYAGTLALLRDTAPVVLACSMNSRILSCIANTVLSVRFAEFLVTDFLLEALLGGDAESAESCIIAHLAGLSSVPLIGIALTLPPSVGLSSPSDMHHLGTQVAAHIPSLLYIGLESRVGRSRWTEHSYTWYSVLHSKDADHPQLALLPPWQGDLVEDDLLRTPRDQT